jgi:hypothetical protein
MSTPSDANETCVGPSSENAGKASSCAGCPNQGACSSGEAKKAEPIGLGIYHSNIVKFKIDFLQINSLR